MSRTNEQREFFEKLRGLVAAAGLTRVRIVPDAEGFPIVPGRLGQVEWLGAAWRTGDERLYVFTNRARMIAKLLAIPGVHKHQMGDSEARLWFGAHDVACLREVCRTIRARARRAGGPGNPDALRRAREARTAPAAAAV